MVLGPFVSTSPSPPPQHVSGASSGEPGKDFHLDVDGISISSGSHHVCALEYLPGVDMGGPVRCWGLNRHNQSMPPEVSGQWVGRLPAWGAITLCLSLLPPLSFLFIGSFRTNQCGSLLFLWDRVDRGRDMLGTCTRATIWKILTDQCGWYTWVWYHVW